jgi:hypothetical protein
MRKLPAVLGKPPRSTTKQMITIKEVLTLPSDSMIPSIQGQMVEVYERRMTKTQKPVQDARLRDASGAEIKLSIWDHPDCALYKGREVIIQSGPKSALKVKFDDYKKPGVNTLSVSGTCTFQFLEVHHAQNGVPSQSGASGSVPTEKSGPAPTPYRDLKAEGQRNGMCFKLAGDFYISRAANGVDIDEAQFVKGVRQLACDLVNAAKDLEAALA